MKDIFSSSEFSYVRHLNRFEGDFKNLYPVGWALPPVKVYIRSEKSKAVAVFKPAASKLFDHNNGLNYWLYYSDDFGVYLRIYDK